MLPLLECVRRGQRIVGDGAWGTMLLDRGLPPGQPPERWVLERPEILSQLAEEYLQAGAQIITTNTFGGSPARLRHGGLADRLVDINTAAVALARGAAVGRAWVSASVGPSGALLRPHGDADPDDIKTGFTRQAQALASAGADLFCIETMTDLAEAVLAVRAAREAAPGAAIMATMTFDATRRGPFTMMGVSVEQAARGLEAAGADIVGANCGTGVDAMLDVARAFARHTRLPIAVRPNAGLPQRRDGRLVYDDTPERFAAAAASLFALGVAIVGGCCGTTPAHIAALASRARAG